MTVIAYRDGVLSADRSLSSGEGFHILSACKINTYKSRKMHVIAATAGDATADTNFRLWVEGGLEGEAPRGQQGWYGILAMRDKDGVNVVCIDGDGMFEIPDGQFYAIGSGRTMAMTAMDLGCTAPEACLAAAHRMGVAHHGIDVVKIGGRVRRFNGKLPTVQRGKK